MNDITITTIDEVIEQLGNYTGAWLFDDNGNLKKDVLAIDTRELLKAFKDADFEVDADEALDICNGLIQEHGDDMYSTFNGFTFSNIAVVSDNSYNWNSPLTHDININEFKYNDESYVAIMVHLGGDIRGNYSYYVLLHCDFDALVNIDWFPEVKIPNYNMVADLRWYSDSYNVYDYDSGNDIGDFYEIDMDDLIKEIEKTINY